MYKVCTLNKISNEGIERFDERYQISDELEGADAALVRSANMHELEMPDSIEAVGRAGAGVNNIPIEDYVEKGIVVMNTPGANANAVKELVILGVLLSSRKVAEGMRWVETLEENVAKTVEKGKGQFAGPEIAGKKIGIIGLGAIGVKVANSMKSLGMEVIGYDPYISIDAAWGLSRSVKHAASLEEVIQQADYLSLHIPLSEKTRYIFNKETFNLMKDNVRILNFSRDALVNNEDLKRAIADGKVAKYVTDFPVEELLGVEGIVCLPHLGASTPESEANCARMAANQIRVYLEEGNIINSVNLPNCEMVWKTPYRLTIIHKNIPAMIGSITKVLAEQCINITDMMNKSKGKWAYTIIDADTPITEGEVEEIKRILGVVKVRSLEK